LKSVLLIEKNVVLTIGKFNNFFLLINVLMDIDTDHNSSDPDIEFIDKDSGMSSLSGSKDDTPERKIIVSFQLICSFFARWLKWTLLFPSNRNNLPNQLLS
jgi:hypothetical protein